MVAPNRAVCTAHPKFYKLTSRLVVPRRRLIEYADPEVARPASEDLRRCGDGGFRGQAPRCPRDWIGRTAWPASVARTLYEDLTPPTGCARAARVRPSATDVAWVR